MNEPLRTCLTCFYFAEDQPGSDGGECWDWHKRVYDPLGLATNPAPRVLVTMHCASYHDRTKGAP